MTRYLDHAITWQVTRHVGNSLFAGLGLPATLFLGVAILLVLAALRRH